MARVPARTYKDFATRRVIIEKVINRRLGFEGDLPPQGWKWDHRHVIADKVTETLPCPDLKGSHLLGIPRSYWQNGPVAGRRRDDLKVEEIREGFVDGQNRWLPVIHRGDLNVWRASAYLFSDDSVTETLDYVSMDSNGSSTHTLGRILRAGSPISAVTYRRDLDNEYVPWRDFVRRERFTGLLEDGTELVTRTGDEITWANVDTTKREFISFVHDDEVHLLFNQFVGEEPTALNVPSGMLDFNELEYLGSSSEQNGERFFSKFFPLSDDVYLRVYVVNVSAETWTEYDVVSDFTADDQVLVDKDLGIFTFGEEGTTAPAMVNHAIYLMYRAVPRVEYEEEGFRDEIVAKEADVNPLGQNLNRGFVAVSRSELDIASIVLETTEPVYGSGTTLNAFGPVYVGADYAILRATVRSSSGEPVPNTEVTFFTETSPEFGMIGGKANRSERMTGYDGVARNFYTPPTSVEEMGFYATSVTSGNRLTVGWDAYFEDVQDIYTYYVLKDDPWKGVVGADTAIGEIEWTGDPPNGRRVVFYKWDAAAVNPVSGFMGAYAPVRPTSIAGGNVLTYLDPLEDPDSTPSTTNLGAYWIVSDRYLTFRASAYSPKYGRRIFSNRITLRVEIPQYMKGSYINTELQDIPFGYRIKDDTYEVASAINGATFITINPVAGPYPIVDVIAGDTWDYTGDFWPYGAYPTSGVSRPFAHFSLYWVVV